jgi:hypothetical protein
MNFFGDILFFVFIMYVFEPVYFYSLATDKLNKVLSHLRGKRGETTIASFKRERAAKASERESEARCECTFP